MKKHFETGDVVIATCCFCGKEDRECILAKCAVGTLEGPVCFADFKKLSKARSGKQGASDAPRLSTTG